MKIEQSCPTCGSHDIMKSGTTRRGKQNHKCKDCGRQFVEDPQWKPKDRDTVSLINLLLVEKIPLAGIARATGVSESWLQKYVNDFYETVPQELEVLPKVVLAGREWLVGTFSIADILMTDVLRLVDRFEGLAAYPACHDYVTRATARPSFVKAHADQMAHFAAAD
jgi:transposase-like protein